MYPVSYGIAFRENPNLELLEREPNRADGLPSSDRGRCHGSRTVNRPLQGTSGVQEEPALRRERMDCKLHLLGVPALKLPRAGNAIVKRADRPRTGRGGKDFSSLRGEKPPPVPGGERHNLKLAFRGRPHGAITNVASGAGNGSLADERERVRRHSFSWSA